MKVATFRWWAKGSRGAASERPTVLHICFCNFQLAAWSTSLEVITVFHAWSHGRLVEMQINHRRKKIHRMNQGSNFLKGSFSNRDNVRASIQFRRESQPQHLKRSVFLKSRSIIFHVNRTSVIRLVKRNQLNFPALKSTSHFLP